MSGAVLEAMQVSKVLGQRRRAGARAKGVDLALRGGELTLLMGPSGSGKTTLLSILGCMLTPTSGTVSLAAVDETANAERRAWRGCAASTSASSSRSYHLFPTLTASENVQLALDLRGETQRDGARARA